MGNRLKFGLQQNIQIVVMEKLFGLMNKELRIVR